MQQTRPAISGFDRGNFNKYDHSDDDERSPHARRKAVLVSSGVAVVVAVVAALVFTGTIKVPGVVAKPVPTVGFSPSGSDAGSNATQTASAFLTAWQNGNVQTAANITDSPAEALAALTAYRTDLKLSGLTLLPGTASAAGWVTFSVTAQVGKPASDWAYSSGLAAYQGSVDGVTRWFVKWKPAVVFTSLQAGQKLALGAIPATASSVVDRNGTQLTNANAPSLANIITSLEKNAPTTDGTAGQEVDIVTTAGVKVAKIAKVSDPVNTTAVKTTIDVALQQTAQSAVGRAANSSMVVIQPSTGDILAIANNPPTGLDTAMVGKFAPGSTFKTVTSALVLNKGLVADLNQTVPCPKTLVVDGLTLHNSGEESGTNFSYLNDFAQSCNNAFSSFHNRVSGSDLSNTAHDYFGFNQPWDVGLGQPTVYGSVPVAQGSELAESLVGQATITASPLAMASVAATVANGSFKQPILVPGAAQVPGTTLPAGTDTNIKTLMRAVVTSGTLSPVFGGAAGIYGKTGTAEVQGKKANSWTIAFKGDYAVAALGIGGNFGAQTAGPECKVVLNSVP